MKKVVRILVVLSFSTLSSALIAQESDLYHLNQQSFKFRDGIYTNIGMIKNNCPIPSIWIESDMEVNDRDFYKKITKNNEIIFFDDNGVRTRLDTRSIWGYSCDGDLHINVGGEFHKFDFVGRVSYFRASKNTYAPIGFEKYHSPGDVVYIQPIILTLRNEEFLVDIIDNKVWEFDLEGLERVLKNDSELWSEFKTLKKRQMEYMKYIFLKRYNKKYPLDIPSE